MKTDGILIALEGIDGSGKSTLAHNLSTLLTQHHIATLLTREPGATSIGKHIRSWLHTNDEHINHKAEFLLFAADRAQHIQEIIRPKMATRTVIISDRMADSSLVYQGYGRGLNHTVIQSINQWVMDQITPDLTLYLRTSYPIAQKRLMQRHNLNNFDKQDAHFIQRLINGFEEIYKERKDVLIIDASQSITDVTQHAYHAIQNLIYKKWHTTI